MMYRGGRFPRPPMDERERYYERERGYERERPFERPPFYDEHMPVPEEMPYHKVCSPWVKVSKFNRFLQFLVTIIPSYAAIFLK